MTYDHSKVLRGIRLSEQGSPLLFASFATGLAGFLDAVGYTQLNHLYVSFMSGNSTHFGMALAAEQWKEALQAGYIIGSFVCGSFVGTLVANAAAKPLITLLCVELMLCAIAFGFATIELSTLALALIALTMGLQNVMHRSVSGTDAGKSFVTGALFELGQAIAQALTMRGNFEKAFVHASSWFSFITGVGCGALSISGLGLISSLALACLSLGLLLGVALLQKPETGDG